MDDQTAPQQEPFFAPLFLSVWLAVKVIAPEFWSVHGTVYPSISWSALMAKSFEVWYSSLADMQIRVQVAANKGYFE